MDITTVPMAHGFIYLAAVIDWFSHKIFGLKAGDHAIRGLLHREALSRHGRLEIFNTDQGSQSTSTEFIKVLKTADIAISMDGKGAQAATTSSSSGSGGR